MHTTSVLVACVMFPRAPIKSRRFVAQTFDTMTCRRGAIIEPCVGHLLKTEIDIMHIYKSSFS